jgi:hypothetical protein
MIQKSINYVKNKFTNSQLKKYQILSAIAIISQLLLIVSIVLIFFFSFWIVIIGILQLLIVQRFTFLCVNCLSYSKVLIEEKPVNHSDYMLKRSPTQILFLQTYKCKKCDFNWENLVERTGHLDGIATMSRDIKTGGKSRMKGESYLSYWRRSKS